MYSETCVLAPTQCSPAIQLETAIMCLSWILWLRTTYIQRPPVFTKTIQSCPNGWPPLKGHLYLKVVFCGLTHGRLITVQYSASKIMTYYPENPLFGYLFGWFLNLYLCFRGLSEPRHKQRTTSQCQPRAIPSQWREMAANDGRLIQGVNHGSWAQTQPLTVGLSCQKWT